MKAKMKRVSMDSHQSRPTNVEAKAKLKYQNLLQDYLELQKEFVSKKRKLQTAKLNRENLLSEVRFLRRRRKYLLKSQSPKDEPKFVQEHNSDECGQLPANERNYNVNEAVLKDRSPMPDMKRISNDEEHDLDRKEDIVCELLRVENKPKNCLINDKIVEKKKISLQDQVALKV
ncbi:uncharacterized protein LOC132190083 [Corylus avellana]|uniref:uncharacterized protein LOC132190083 n=1 Tax=Corylus avellana TaxID=13451 RepID=UPI001E207E43|nr:uncharacterized protein LOC132190083 [Corylus avellana]